MSEARAEAPPGFEAYRHESPYLTGAVGAVMERRHNRGVALGLRVGEKQTNARGLAHGGLLSTVADVALGHAIAIEAGSGHPTTLSLAIDFIRPVPLQSWLQVETAPLRVGGRLAFSSAQLFADAELVARASGTFVMSRSTGYS